MSPFWAGNEDAFAGLGEGRVGSYAIGDFKVTNYMKKDTTGREVSTETTLAELADTSLSLCVIGGEFGNGEERKRPPWPRTTWPCRDA